jgi:hypothetical protein
MNNQHKPQVQSNLETSTKFAEAWRQAVLGNQQARMDLVQRFGKQNGRSAA